MYWLSRSSDKKNFILNKSNTPHREIIKGCLGAFGFDLQSEEEEEEKKKIKKAFLIMFY